MIESLPTTPLVSALLAGDEATFEQLVAEYYPLMRRLAWLYLHDEELAEEVIQETWLAMLKGLPQFEGRSSLRTWVCSILINRARTLATRENRRRYDLPLEDENTDSDEPAVALDRFNSDGHWVSPPDSWDNLPEKKLLSQETLQQVHLAIQALPPRQREVITLRDLQHWSSEEVCALLNLTDNNERVLLHRARAKVRQHLENYFQGGD